MTTFIRSNHAKRKVPRRTLQMPKNSLLYTTQKPIFLQLLTIQSSFSESSYKLSAWAKKKSVKSTSSQSVSFHLKQFPNQTQHTLCRQPTLTNRDHGFESNSDLHAHTHIYTHMIQLKFFKLKKNNYKN